jgi:hypothetical protein
MKPHPSEMVFGGTELTDSIRQEVISNHILPKLGEFTEKYHETVANEMKLGWKEIGRRAQTEIATKAAIAGLVTGALAYLALRPKSWTNQIKVERSNQSSVSSPSNELTR